MNILRRIFGASASRLPNPTGKIIDMSKHNGWGDSISWWDFDKRRLTGHLTPLPKVGDEVRCEMSNGKTARFIITSVEQCRDPRDMFFANAEEMVVEEAYGR